MKIVISDAILLRMETWCATAGGREVSGLGTVEVRDADIHVTGIYLLDMGSAMLTDIPPERIAAIYQRGVLPDKLKLWWHPHPLGNGIPGPHNWSALDDSTILDAPLGSSPALVKWSVSIVRTPLGWVGRVDHYTKKKTSHLEVTQPFTPQAHAALLALGKPPKPVQKKRVVLGRIKRRKHPKKWLLRQLKRLHISYSTYHIMAELLRAGIPAEDVSEIYGIDLMDMREMQLITWYEMEKAMPRQHDQHYIYDGQQEMWSD